MERSVKFNFNEEVVVRLSLVLEGEVDNSKPSEVPNIDGNLDIVEPLEAVQPINVTEGRGKQLRKETEYVRMLKEGTAVTGQRTGILLKGMRGGSNVKSAVDVDVEEHVMASVIESAEGIMLTYEEARRCPDWPKWEEAIQKELESLKKVGTWELLKRPPGGKHS